MIASLGASRRVGMNRDENKRRFAIKTASEKGDWFSQLVMILTGHPGAVTVFRVVYGLRRPPLQIRKRSRSLPTILAQIANFERYTHFLRIEGILAVQLPILLVQMIITIVGAGNGGHVLAALAGARPNVSVRILTTRPSIFGSFVDVERPGKHIFALNRWN